MSGWLNRRLYLKFVEGGYKTYTGCPCVLLLIILRQEQSYSTVAVRLSAADLNGAEYMQSTCTRQALMLCRSAPWFTCHYWTMTRGNYQKKRAEREFGQGAYYYTAMAIEVRHRSFKQDSHRLNREPGLLVVSRYWIPQFIHQRPVLGRKLLHLNGVL